MRSVTRSVVRGLSSAVKRIAAINHRDLRVAINSSDRREKFLAGQVPESNTKKFVVLLEGKAVTFAIKNDFNLFADLILGCISQEGKISCIAVMQKVIVNEIPTPRLIVPAK